MTGTAEHEAPTVGEQRVELSIGVSRDGSVPGVPTVADTVKETSSEAVRELRAGAQAGAADR